MNAIFKRVSIRKYEGKLVEPEKIEQILRAAMAAPSAGDQRPWEFYVVRDQEIIRKLSECSPYSGCAAGAPVVIVPCMRTEGLRFPSLDQIDLAIATEHILLEATELGLGAVWLAIAPIDERMEAVESVIDMGESLRPFALVPVGYPAEKRPQEDRFDLNRIHCVG